MKKYCQIHFTDSIVGDYDTDNSTHFIANDDLSPGKFIIEWELLDNSAANKFYTLSKNLIEKNNRTIHWNQYLKDNKQASQEIFDLVNELNDAVDVSTALLQNPSMPERLKINLDNDNSESILKKLNEIHFIFEKNLMATDHENIVVIKLCEKLNKLVHQIEHMYVNNSDERLNGYTSNFVVVRQYTQSLNEDENRIEADDSDYNLFDINTDTGDLFSDFYTVGKDLVHAYATKDIELVTNKEVKHQKYVSASVAFTLWEPYFQNSTKIDHQQFLEEYHDWCRDNNVEEYGYDFSMPCFNPGRAKIGKLLNTDFNMLQENLLKFPYISNVIVYEK